MIFKVLFWFFVSVIVYTYLGYTLLLMFLAGLKRLKGPRQEFQRNFEPVVTLLIPAFNEADYIKAKVTNTRALNYPPDKLRVIWITDGSNDTTAERLQAITGIKFYHERERRGKVHAMNRGIKFTDTPIVIFTDANTMLNKEAVREIVLFFSDKKTGCVAGEKRISAAPMEKAVSAGEGLYWKYESFIKRLESETGSAVGAAGEIFAIRSELYEEVVEDTLLDDFTISMMIARKGYKIKYAPGAWGAENASISISEELKRKIRIAAGGMQAMTRMTGLLNPFVYGLLSLKYISHKVLRWTLAPFSFPLILFLNTLILLTPGYPKIYLATFLFQCLYYVFALAGAFLHQVKKEMKAIFAPYYLLVMNYAVIAGIVHYIMGRYTVNWQKVKRS